MPLPLSYQLALVLAIALFVVLPFCLMVALARWMFRVNHAIKLLDSIDESLRLAPWMRTYSASPAGRKVA